MAGIECVVIDEDTSPAKFRNELRWNEIAWHFGK
jgi:L-arabinose isomerase